MITCAYDPAYEAARNALIPVAEAMADGRCPKPENASAADERRWSVHWDAAFHRAMAELMSDPFRAQGVQ